LPTGLWAKPTALCAAQACAFGTALPRWGRPNL
jgi:hypothetical protein